MSRFILDHRSPDKRVTGQAAVAVLPPAARAIRYVPDISALKPGDLILSREITPGWIGRRIAQMQSAAGLDAAHSCWTHAAILLYDNIIVEAVPEAGVRTSNLYNDLASSIFLVRRLPDLDDANRYKIALSATKMIGARYTVLKALWMGWQMRKGLWNPNSSIELGRNIICSRVFYDAVLEITLRVLRDCPTYTTTPAHLSATPTLEDVDVGWPRLV